MRDFYYSCRTAVFYLDDWDFIAGTHQAQVHEEDRSLEEWQALFESAGLRVERRWRDLHVLSASWIFRGPWYLWFIRATQALALPLWPLSWQYQVYHLCGLKHR